MSGLVNPLHTGPWRNHLHYDALGNPISSTLIGSSYALNVNILGGGGSGGTASTFGAAFPGVGTAAGFKTPGALMAAGNLDISGNLLVNVAAGGGAGGTSAVDGSNFTAGVSSGTPLMAEDPTSGHLLVAQMVAGTRNLQVGGSLAISAATSNAATAPSQTTIGTAAATALGANGARKGFMIQNQGTTVIKVLLGAAVPTQSNYTVALAPGGTANDGSSQPYYGPPGLIWTGAIQWISSAAGGLAEVIEFT